MIGLHLRLVRTGWANRFRRSSRRRAVPALLGLLSIAVFMVQAQTPPRPAASSPSTPSVRAIAPPRSEQGPAWATLKPAQREALAPLERDWPGIDGLPKRKWLEIAERFPSLPAPDQARLQARMAEWAKLTPLERSQARLNFQEAKQAPPQNRQASWEAYQALPPEQRRELAERAAPAAASAIKMGQPLARPAPTASADGVARSALQSKSNAVPDPAPAAPLKPVAPIVVQAQPGATTSLLTKQPTPPAHQPSGLPKIAATPAFVDTKTLLPQTGAQSVKQSVSPTLAPTPAPASVPTPVAAPVPTPTSASAPGADSAPHQ